jgi:preprotein translocase subunit SecY
MWLGEQITERGIGNGISLVISIGILARLPQAVISLYDMFIGAEGVEARFNFFHAIVMVLLLFGVIAGVIAVTRLSARWRCNMRNGRSGGRLFPVAARSCLCV